MESEAPLAALVGAHALVPCLDGTERPYRDLDCAASTPALAVRGGPGRRVPPVVLERAPGRGLQVPAGHCGLRGGPRERRAPLRRPARPGGDDVVVLVRNTTEAINHLAYRLALGPRRRRRDHRGRAPRQPAALGPGGHAALGRVRPRRHLRRRRRRAGARRRAPAHALWRSPAPPTSRGGCRRSRRSAPPPTSAASPSCSTRRSSRRTGRCPPGPTSSRSAGTSSTRRSVPARSSGRARPSRRGDPFLAGGGAVDLVDLDEVIWTEPPEREEAGSPNVVGAVAFGAAMDELERIGWDAIARARGGAVRPPARGARARSTASACSGRADGGAPRPTTTARRGRRSRWTGMHHALVAARLSAEFGIGVRHGCFCAHPYLIRLLGVGRERMAAARAAVRRGDRSGIPGAVRASCGLGTSGDDVDALLDALAALASGAPAPVRYVQDEVTGDFWPEGEAGGWGAADRPAGAACAAGDRVSRSGRRRRRAGSRHRLHWVRWSWPGGAGPCAGGVLARRSAAPRCATSPGSPPAPRSRCPART